MFVGFARETVKCACRATGSNALREVPVTALHERKIGVEPRLYASRGKNIPWEAFLFPKLRIAFLKTIKRR